MFTALLIKHTCNGWFCIDWDKDNQVGFKFILLAEGEWPKASWIGEVATVLDKGISKWAKVGKGSNTKSQMLYCLIEYRHNKSQ